METVLPDEFKIAILIASIDAHELLPMNAALKTMPDKEATWGTISARLLDEFQSIRNRRLSTVDRASLAYNRCLLCDKPGQRLEKC